MANVTYQWRSSRTIWLVLQLSMGPWQGTDFLSPVATLLRKGDIELPFVRPFPLNNFKSYCQNLMISHTHDLSLALSRWAKLKKSVLLRKILRVLMAQLKTCISFIFLRQPSSDGGHLSITRMQFLLLLCPRITHFMFKRCIPGTFSFHLVIGSQLWYSDRLYFGC